PRIPRQAACLALQSEGQPDRTAKLPLRRRRPNIRGMTQNTPPKRGLARNAANYGDPDFALYLRRSFAKSMGYSQAMLDRPVVGIVDTGSDYNNCPRPGAGLVAA